MPQEKRQLIPAVILSCHTTGLAIIRSLGIMGVPIIAATYEPKVDMGHHSRYVKKILTIPHPENSEENFIGALTDFAKNKERMALIPADDLTLLAVARNKNLLDEYYMTFCADRQITETVLNKKLSYQIAKENNIEIPDTYFPKSIDEAIDQSHSLTYPFLIKPYFSHHYFKLFHLKMVLVNSLEEMKTEYNRALRSGVEIMLQQHLAGDDSLEVNYNSFISKNGEMIEFTGEKVRLAPPRFGVPCVVKSCGEISEVSMAGRKLLNAIGYRGYSCTEFKKDVRDGRYKLLEVNGRHNRSSLLCLLSGINFPWIMYEDMLYKNPPLPIPTYSKGNYWIDEFRDLASLPGRLIKFKYMLKSFLIPYFKKHVFAVFSIKDVKPFVYRVLYILSIILKSSNDKMK